MGLPMKRIVGVFLLAMLGILPVRVFGQARPTEFNQDQQAILQNAVAFVEAFNRGDAKAIAALFVEQGEMSVDGEVIAKGRSAIEQSYAEFFRERRGIKITVDVESLNQIRPDLIIEKGTSEILDVADDVSDAYTAIHTKEEGRWLTVSAEIRQSTTREVSDWRDSLEPLVGSWVASKGDWRVTTKFSWFPGRNFFKREFKVFQGEQETGFGNSSHWMGSD